MRKSPLQSWFLLVLIATFIAPVSLAASSFTMHNYGEVLVENLQIGQNYSMTELVNLPLTLTNGSDKAIHVKIEVQKPSADKIKPGFEPIPDTAWVQITPEEADIPAQSTYSTDVKISIPEAEEHIGKKYHVNIYARQVAPEGTGGMIIALAVQGRLLFTVGSKQAVQATASQVDMSFTVKPVRMVMTDVPLGKKVQVLTAERTPPILTNPGKSRITVRMQSLDPKGTVLNPEPEYVATPNADWLTIEPDEFTVGSGKKRSVKMFVKVPNQPEYADKKFEFTVVVSTGAATAGQRYLHVLVSTAK